MRKTMNWQIKILKKQMETQVANRLLLKNND